MLAWDKGNFHAPGENWSRDPASFSQQVDDWTPLKITLLRKLSKEIFLTKEKETPG